VTADGLIFAPGRLDRDRQEDLRDKVEALLASAPLYTPRMPRSGKPMSVRQSNFGALGWVTDAARGYRYEPRHPETGRAWPPIPDLMLALWSEFAPGWPAPEACLVNWYGFGARMGLHVDADEAAADAPVLSISLGDTAIFRIGGPRRGDATRTFRLASGDALLLSGPSRRAFHGVDRIVPGSSTLLAGGGRLSLTLRRVTLTP
jgi:alkylated DNA repair protein (DNA oxidative demethylase)